MRRKQVWAYYCDFCKKTGRSASAMSKHEKKCTLNPNRVCGMCRAASLEQKPLSELMRIANHGLYRPRGPATRTGNAKLVLEMIDYAEGCPVCVLAALRQSGKTRPVCNEDGLILVDAYPFNYKEEIDKFWAELREREREADERSALYE